MVMACGRVFVHRHRDAEPAIRSECIKALGMWMKMHPQRFLEGNHLRYIGWVLTDTVGISFFLPDTDIHLTVSEHA